MGYKLVKCMEGVLTFVGARLIVSRRPEMGISPRFIAFVEDLNCFEDEQGGTINQKAR